MLYSGDVKIPHSEVLHLHELGKLRLGIDNNLSASMKASNGLLSTPGLWAFRLWELVALAILVSGLVVSFLYAWWAFVPGILLAGAVGRANRQANSQDMLDRAMRDQRFYDDLARQGLIQYAVSPDVAAAFGPIETGSQPENGTLGREQF